MKKFVRLMSVVVAVLMMVMTFASCKKDDVKGGDEQEELVIGCSGPLTGGASVYGIAVKNSAEMAVEEINAAGGVTMNGHTYKLKFVMLDDEHKAEKVSTTYPSLLERGMKISLGTVTTAPGLEFKEMAKNDNLFFLTPSASANDIVSYDNGYQMCFADGNQGAVAADYVNKNFSGQTIGVLYKSDEDYSKGIYDQFKAALSDSVNVVETSFSGETVASFSSQIETLKNCKFVFMPIYYTPAAQFMTEARGTMPNDAVYYGCDGLDGIATGVDGFDISTIPQEVSYLSHFDSKATTGKAGDYVKKYTEKYGQDTLNQFGASAYDCVYALAEALKQCNNLTAESSVSDFCNALKGVFNGGFTFSGVTGNNVKWGSDGYVNKEAIKYVVKSAD